jgi:hypothetical protein
VATWVGSIRNAHRKASGVRGGDRICHSIREFGRDEYSRKRFVSWVGGNNANSLWPEVSRERLAAVDARMYAIVGEIFANLESRYGGQPGEQLSLEFAA